MNRIKRIKKKFFSIKTAVTTAITGTFCALMTVPAFAATFTLNGSASAEEIGNKAINKTQATFRIIGGVCIVVSLAIAAIGLMTARNRPEKRQQILEHIGWICGGSFILGILTVISTFVFNIGA